MTADSEPILSQLSAIVLTAGASSRMGRPKALLPFGGETALGLWVASLRRAGIEDVVAVFGADPDVEREARRLGARTVPNPIAHMGRTGSLQFGLRETPAERHVLLAPVDCPLVPSEVVAAIVAAAPGHAIVRPTHAGRGGHPVFLASELRAEILALAPDASLRAVIHRDPARRLDLAVESPEVLRNLDTPGDYETALERFRR